MTQHDPQVRLRHMCDHAQEAIEMLGATTLEELRSDRKLQLALVQLIEIIGAILMPCAISDVNLPSFLQERLGFLNTDGWSDPDCCDRLSIFGRLDRESCHLAPLLCRDPGGGKNFD